MIRDCQLALTIFQVSRSVRFLKLVLLSLTAVVATLVTMKMVLVFNLAARTAVVVS
jgi:hypothetical protein